MCTCAAVLIDKGITSRRAHSPRARSGRRKHTTCTNTPRARSKRRSHRSAPSEHRGSSEAEAESSSAFPRRAFIAEMAPDIYGSAACASVVGSHYCTSLRKLCRCAGSLSRIDGHEMSKKPEYTKTDRAKRQNNSSVDETALCHAACEESLGDSCEKQRTKAFPPPAR